MEKKSSSRSFVTINGINVKSQKAPVSTTSIKNHSREKPAIKTRTAVLKVALCENKRANAWDVCFTNVTHFTFKAGAFCKMGS